jgi:hypothetical protein
MNAAIPGNGVIIPSFPIVLQENIVPRPVFPITPLISSPFFARAKVHHHSSLEEVRTMRRGDSHLFPAKRLIFFEFASFLAFIGLIWIGEYFDIPHYCLGAEMTPFNWREALFETLVILPLALVVIYSTRKVFERMRYLEGFLHLCSHCKKVADEEGQWQEIEQFVQKRSEARFSHGICPDCAKQLYPEVFTTASKEGMG